MSRYCPYCEKYYSFKNCDCLSRGVEPMFYNTKSILEECMNPKESKEKNNFSRTKTEYGECIEIDIPGVSPQDVRLYTTGKQIEVSGSRKNKNFLYRFDYTGLVDITSADIKNGVLTIKVQFNLMKPNKTPIKITY